MSGVSSRYLGAIVSVMTGERALTAASQVLFLFLMSGLLLPFLHPIVGSTPIIVYCGFVVAGTLYLLILFPLLHRTGKYHFDYSILVVASLFWVPATFFWSLISMSFAELSVFSTKSHSLFDIFIFQIELTLNGLLIDVMEHWDIHISRLHMNMTNNWFVTYCFVYRTYCAVLLLEFIIVFYRAWKLARQRRLARPFP